MCRILPCSLSVTRAPTESSSGTFGSGRWNWYSGIDRATQHGQRLRPVRRRPPDTVTGDPHGTEPEPVDGQITAHVDGSGQPGIHLRLLGHDPRSYPWAPPGRTMWPCDLPPRFSSSTDC